jgi:hypothetical protein
MKRTLNRVIRGVELDGALSPKSGLRSLGLCLWIDNGLCVKRAFLSAYSDWKLFWMVRVCIGLSPMYGRDECVVRIHGPHPMSLMQHTP